jgi:acyl transferase domain-containing protein
LKQLTSPALPKHAVSSIAVTAMSFRLPGATHSSLSLQALDTITRIPYNRWDTVYASQQVGELQASFGSFVAGAAAFDAAAFGLPEAEALLMDPQQRLLMEASWESLGPAVSAASNAGASGAAAYRAACGVFVGVSSRDYFTLGKEYSQVQINPVSRQASHTLVAAVV